MHGNRRQDICGCLYGCDSQFPNPNHKSELNCSTLLVQSTWKTVSRWYISAMFRVYQVKFAQCDRRYRGQIMCGPSGGHHHHMYASMPCSPCAQPGIYPQNLPAMPPPLTPINYQSYIDTAQQLDAVAVRKAVSTRVVAGAGSPAHVPPKSESDGNSGEDCRVDDPSYRNPAAAEGDHQDQAGGLLSRAGLAAGESKSASGKETDLTWIDWAWPGSHTPCPFNSRHPSDRLSTRTHRLSVGLPCILAVSCIFISHKSECIRWENCSYKVLVL